MVQTYLDSRPDPKVYDFLRHDFAALESRHGGVVGTSFRTFPSFPQGAISNGSRISCRPNLTPRRSKSSRFLPSSIRD